MWTNSATAGTSVDELSANLHITCGKSVGKPRQGGFPAQAGQAAEGLPAAGKPAAGIPLECATRIGGRGIVRGRRRHSLSENRNSCYQQWAGSSAALRTRIRLARRAGKILASGRRGEKKANSASSACKSLISFKIAKEKAWKSLEKAWKKLGKVCKKL
jgi:hypothetical protein